MPVGGLVAGGAEEHDRVPAAEPGGVHERLAAHVDRAVRVARRAQLGGGLGGEEQLRLRRRQDREPLLLRGEEAAEGRLAGRQRVRGMLGDDQVDLAVERAARVVVERAAGERGADGEHHDRRHGERRGDPDEEPAPQRAWAVEPAHTAGLVPGAAHRPDQLGPVELPPQLRDVDVDGARAAREREAPDALEQALARHHDAGVGEEEGEQVELHARQLDLVAARRRRCGRPCSSTMSPTATRSLVLVGLGPPQDGPHARDELAGRERLRHVVVRAELEPGDAVDLLVARRHDHDRQARGAADGTAEIEAVGVGKLEVEDREPDLVLLERQQRLGAPRGPDHPEAVLLEVGADERRDVLLVLDEQDRPTPR